VGSESNLLREELVKILDDENPYSLFCPFESRAARRCAWFERPDQDVAVKVNVRSQNDALIKCYMAQRCRVRE
jgi:hypothetical protein